MVYEVPTANLIMHGSPIGTAEAKGSKCVDKYALALQKDSLLACRPRCCRISRRDHRCNLLESSTKETTVNQLTTPTMMA
eukprot:scaffold16568_cov96-Skeletonema_dohrnii-CCMP3373.AAC.1